MCDLTNVMNDFSSIVIQSAKQVNKNYMLIVVSSRANMNEAIKLANLTSKYIHSEQQLKEDILVIFTIKL